MNVAAYGSEQGALTDSLARRAFLRFAGSYDLGARVRYAAVEPELARIPAPRRVLDAGSGRGELCFAMARRWPNAEIVGVDFDEVLIDHANQLREIHFPSREIRFVAAQLPHHFEEPFDVVVSIDVLEHIEDDTALLRSLYDVTAKEGTLILHTPAEQQRRILAEFEDHHEHVREGYERETLATLLRDAGYRDVTVRPTFGRLGALAWEGFALARGGNGLAAAALPLWYAFGALDGLRVPAHGIGLLATARR
jgi:trans-aconitate methyltransferase